MDGGERDAPAVACNLLLHTQQPLHGVPVPISVRNARRGDVCIFRVDLAICDVCHGRKDNGGRHRATAIRSDLNNIPACFDDAISILICKPMLLA